MNTPVICASLYQSVPSGVNSAGLLVQVRLKACVATIVSANLSFAMVMAAPKYARVVSRTKPPLELELKVLLLLLLLLLEEEGTYSCTRYCATSW